MFFEKYPIREDKNLSIRIIAVATQVDIVDDTVWLGDLLMPYGEFSMFRCTLNLDNGVSFKEIPFGWVKADEEFLKFDRLWKEEIAVALDDDCNDNAV